MIIRGTISGENAYAGGFRTAAVTILGKNDLFTVLRWLRRSIASNCSGRMFENRVTSAL